MRFTFTGITPDGVRARLGKGGANRVQDHQPHEVPTGSIPGRCARMVARPARGPRQGHAGMLRYVQSHWSSGLDPATGLATGRPGLFDGHAEHWFADEASYRSAMASDEWHRCIADGPTFFDGPSLVGGQLDETMILWTPSGDGSGY